MSSTQGTHTKSSHLAAAAEVGKILSHPLRLAALVEVEGLGEASPSVIADRLGELLSHTSYHVKRLLEAGCLKLAATHSRRGALEHVYRVTPRGRAVLELLATI